MTFSLTKKLGLSVKDIGNGAGAGNGPQQMGETRLQKMQKKKEDQTKQVKLS